MDDGKIEEFLTKNAKKKETRITIQHKIELQVPKNKRSTPARRLYQIIATPLFLQFLIDIVDRGKDIPDKEGEIVAKFMQGLYDRERIDKSDARINEKTIHKLLSILGYKSLEKYGTNTAMEERWVNAVLVKTAKEYGFTVDINYITTLCTELNILAYTADKYTFRHQSYQDYYQSEGEWILLEEEDVDIQS